MTSRESFTNIAGMWICSSIFWRVRPAFQSGFFFCDQQRKIRRAAENISLIDKKEFCEPGYRNEAGILWQEVYESIR
ncbi:hypothetical protein BHK98_09655 [Hornefia porci]|uniref:Uncharacterized protein n=1 Tax=Hornefia porci TaxID=2652292 RepID=A0A1Q9JJC0_9FIRM|nr:hypothetical protein BHK98_09655 [Hornefia porci]